MGNLQSNTVGEFNKGDNGFYKLGNAKIISSITKCGSYTFNEIMKDCPVGETCKIEKDEKDCVRLIINKNNVDGEYYRKRVGNLPVGDYSFVYNDKNSKEYDSSKPSYMFLEKDAFNRDLEKIKEEHRMKSMYLNETVTLGGIFELAGKYKNNRDKMFEDVVIPDDWCLEMDPCPDGLKCCDSSSKSVSSVSFFEKNKKAIVIGSSVIIGLLAVGIFIYHRRSSSVQSEIIPKVVKSRKSTRR
jgi:hypothetical protein